MSDTESKKNHKKEKHSINDVNKEEVTEKISDEKIKKQILKIEFDPFLNTFDIDSVAVITSLKFKYSCQLIDSNLEMGYPSVPGSNQTIIHLDEFKTNNSLLSYLSCFNSTGFYIFKYNSKLKNFFPWSCFVELK